MGPDWKRKTRCAALLDEHVGADDVGGHQVGRELDAVEGAVEDVRDRAHQHRLAEAGHAFQQRVRVGHEADEHLPNELVLAHDDLLDLTLDGACLVGERLRREGRGGCGLGARHVGGLLRHVGLLAIAAEG